MLAFIIFGQIVPKSRNGVRQATISLLNALAPEYTRNDLQHMKFFQLSIVLLFSIITTLSESNRAQKQWSSLYECYRLLR